MSSYPSASAARVMATARALRSYAPASASISVTSTPSPGLNALRPPGSITMNVAGISRSNTFRSASHVSWIPWRSAAAAGSSAASPICST
eukprot:31152-Pelagococcus_subviridis.AAC.5